MEGPTVGTGPWILRSSGQNAAHAFDRNPNYFERGLPFVDRLVVQVVPDRASLDAAFTVGSLDVHLLRRALDEPQRDEAGHRLHTHTQRGQWCRDRFEHGPAPIRPPTTAPGGPPCDGPVEGDRRGVARGGLGRHRSSPRSPGWLLDSSEISALFARPEEARALLADISPGAPVPVTIRVSGFGDSYLAHASLVADEMAAAGFAPTLEKIDRVSYADEVWAGGDFQMFIGPPAHLTTPNQYLLGVLHSRGRLNTTGHATTELDAY